MVTTIPSFRAADYLAPIMHHIDALVTCVEAGAVKPNPRIYLKCLRELDLSPEEAVMVGDDPYLDVEAPKSLGMRAVLLAREPKREPPAADAVISSLDELEEVLARLCQA